ncbi:MAG: sigma-70 family RNA polymerase sigma factor [Roseiflexaceae bacterium]
MSNEAEIIRLARQLDTNTLAHIHDTYYPLVYRYIALRVAERETAEDLTSDVFVRFLKALRERNAPQTTIRGWLFSVASNVVNDHHRRNYRAPHVELSETIESSADPPEQVVEQQIDREDLRKAVASLTEEQRYVIALRFGQELPIQEVAKSLGKSEGAIKQLQARAIAALARRMTGGQAE